jgi:hypothetical protein
VRVNLRNLLFAPIAIITGVIVLLGYFTEWDLLVNLRIELLRGAVILAAVALLVGIANLWKVHWSKFREQKSGWVYSVVMLVSLALTFLVLIVAGYLDGPRSEYSLWLFNNVQAPIEASLMAVLAVVLAYACARMFNRRINVFMLIFIGTVLFVLVGTATFPGFEIPGLREMRSWITQVWALAGVRGILLGVALGIVGTGLRILVGADRPYGG